MIKLTAKGKLISDSLAANLQKQTKDAVEIATKDFIVSLKDRTMGGVGYDGRSFGKYSPGYAAFRKEQGRTTSPVSLFFDGEMLGAIKSKVTQVAKGFVSIISFATTLANDKAYNIMTYQKRKFFGISDQERTEFNRRVQEIINLKEANK